MAEVCPRRILFSVRDVPQPSHRKKRGWKTPQYVMSVPDSIRVLLDLRASPGQYFRFSLPNFHNSITWGVLLRKSRWWM
jgi:hypothetical protein